MAVHLIFLAMEILTFCVVVRHRSAVVTDVLGTAAELILIALVVVIVEVGAYVTVLMEFMQLIVMITLPFWLATVIKPASPFMVVVVIVVTLAAVVDVVIDGRVGIDVDGRISRWVGIVV